MFPLRFIRYLLSFFKPSCQRFCTVHISDPQAKTFSEVGCLLVDFLQEVEDVSSWLICTWAINVHLGEAYPCLTKQVRVLVVRLLLMGIWFIKRLYALNSISLVPCIYMPGMVAVVQRLDTTVDRFGGTFSMDSDLSNG